MERSRAGTARVADRGARSPAQARRRPTGCLLALLLLQLTASCSMVRTSPSTEPLVAFQEVTEATSPFGMVTTSSREATEAAVGVLESGGNAIDAAVAAAFALGSADPSASGLAGMTYVLIRRADGTTTAIEGSALEPELIDRDRLRAVEQATVALDPEATAGYEFVAVPSTVPTLAYTAEKYGTRTLAELLAPAIEIAEHGYLVNRAKRGSIEKYLHVIQQSEHLRFWILKDGMEIPDDGDRYCNAPLARVLRVLAAGGASEFSTGAIASEIEADMIRHGGFLRRADLAAVTIEERAPLSVTYRGVEVLTFPWPGAGGALVEALNILENFSPEELRTDGAERIRILAEACHIALEDHFRFSRDPSDKAKVPTRSHLTEAFAKERARLIRRGKPVTAQDLGVLSPAPRPPGGTTHVSVADHAGNVVALTQTIGRFYGAKVLAPGLGFPYNSLLEGLSSPVFDRMPRRFRIPTPGVPTIVLKNGAPFMALGASGSTKAPPNVVVTISNIVDRGMRPGEAIAAPRILWDLRKLGGGMFLEIAPPLTMAAIDELRALGYDNLHVVEYPTPPRTLTTFGGVNLVQLDAASGLFVGVADPRRGGFALGPRL